MTGGVGPTVMIAPKPPALVPVSLSNTQCLQTGPVVGAICGIRNLLMPLPLDNWQSNALASLAQGLFQAWLPSVGSALSLHSILRFLLASRL
ncbi:hypothetical protein [Synechococcus sp. M16CYN]|uniref:hypothetical protein n=1 Tax=Synechococcus sp. M16CYN TaxID=3103139 RepID=UPI00333F622E